MATNASAQFVSNGPDGGVAYTFYRDGAKTWVAANTGLYYSENDGVTWQPQPIPASLYGCDPILSIASFGNELYAGSMQSGIYHTMDGGVNWALVNNNLQKGAPYTDLEIVGGTAALAIRGDSGILYRTPDHGNNWIRMNFAINNAAAQWLSVHNNNLFVSTDMGLFKSMDNGSTFTNINPNTPDIGKLVWVNDTAYVSTVDGIRMSVDEGVTFTPVGLTGSVTTNVAVFGKNIFASVRSGTGTDTLKYSANGGTSFTNAPFTGAAPFARVHDMHIAGNQVLLGTDYSIYRSAAGAGIGFSRADSGFHSTVIRGMAVNGLRLYAATYPMGIYYSQDSADNWINNGGRAHGLEGDMLAIDARNQYVHAGGRNNYYRSTDFGNTWIPGATGLPAGTVNSIYASKISPDVLLISNGNLYRSTDNGGSFSAVSSGVPANSAYFVTQIDTVAFVAGSGGLYRATSSSLAFGPASGITGPVTSIVLKGLDFYASTAGNGLFMSRDGIAWKAVNVVSPGILPARINALVMNGGYLIAGTDNGLYTDSAGIWAPDSLQGKAIYSVAVVNGKVFASTCGGVWALRNPEQEQPAGINAVSAGSQVLEIYPNPASGSFRARFTSEHAGTATLVIRDMMGRSIQSLQHDVRAGRNDLRVSLGSMQLPAGVYLVQVSIGSQLATRRVVLQ